MRGAWYNLLAKKTLRAVGAALGDRVEVRFRVADQSAVDVPEPLEAALDANPLMRRLWDAQTPGKRRGLAHRVATAKAAATQARRIAEVIGILKGELDMRGKPLGDRASSR